jgi:hypothetical protein
MCYFVLGFVSVSLLMGVGFFETLRWHNVCNECESKRQGYNKLLASDVCKKGFGESVEAICSKADVELRTSIYISTTLEWWRKGEIYALYMRLTESYTSLLFLVLVPILYVIYKIFDAFKQRDIDERVERMIQRQNPIMLSYPQQQQHQQERIRNQGFANLFISGPKDY